MTSHMFLLSLLTKHFKHMTFNCGRHCSESTAQQKSKDQEEKLENAIHRATCHKTDKDVTSSHFHLKCWFIWIQMSDLTAQKETN